MAQAQAQGEPKSAGDGGARMGLTRPEPTCSSRGSGCGAAVKQNHAKVKLWCTCGEVAGEVGQWAQVGRHLAPFAPTRTGTSELSLALQVATVSQFRTIS